MQISKKELELIIKEETAAVLPEGLKDSLGKGWAKFKDKAAINFGGPSSQADRLFRQAGGYGKGAEGGSKGGGDYPATELTALMSTLQKTARGAGIEIKGGPEALVDEFEKILSSQGFKLNEADERVFIGQEGNIEVEQNSAPVLMRLLADIKTKDNSLYEKVIETLGNYRFSVKDLEVLPAAAEPAGEEEAPGEEEEAIQLDPEPGSTEVELTDEPAGEEEETVAIYKGKGGLSLQSFVDRLGGEDPEVKGVIRSTILKHIANQMEKQGVKVVEEEHATEAYKMIAEEFIESLDEAAVAIYNHPDGKEHSLNGALQKLRAGGATGIEKEKLGKLLNALAKWAKSQGLKVNEEIENTVTHRLDERSETLKESKEVCRWRVLSGIK